MQDTTGTKWVTLNDLERWSGRFLRYYRRDAVAELTHSSVRTTRVHGS